MVHDHLALVLVVYPNDLDLVQIVLLQLLIHLYLLSALHDLLDVKLLVPQVVNFLLDRDGFELA